MPKKYRPYVIMAIITLIYLFFFSSRIVVLTNLTPQVFNIISSVIVFFYLDIFYKLYIKQYQLNKVECTLLIASYFIIVIYLLFFKNSGVIDSSTLDLVPYFFTYPKPDQFLLLIGNVLTFLPLGYFFKRYGLKASLIAILALAFAIEGVQYIFKVGVFDLSDILLYTIGFYLGIIYYQFVKYKSMKYDNISYDISLVIIAVIALVIISTTTYMIVY